jgi:ATP-dependent DNA helicase RecQ
LYISPANLAERKKASELRVEAMKKFVRDETECRQITLLKYFGETELNNCGKCDVCKKKASDSRKKEKLNLEDEILTVLRNEQKTVTELVAMFPIELNADVNTALRKLLDREVVGFDKNRKLRII